MGLAGRAAVAARRAAGGGARVACRAVLRIWQAAPPAARRFGLLFAVVRHGASHLWLLNLGVNVFAAVWSLRFWASTDAVAICQALPASGGDPARTIRVARLVLARALNDLARMQARAALQQRQIEAQRDYILRQHEAAAAAAAAASTADAASCGAAAGRAARTRPLVECSADGEEPAAAASCPDGPLGECEVCCARPRDTALGCGHLACARCSVLCAHCPFCRREIDRRIQLFA